MSDRDWNSGVDRVEFDDRSSFQTFREEMGLNFPASVALNYTSRLNNNTLARPLETVATCSQGGAALWLRLQNKG